MRGIVREGLQAGALGLSVSKNRGHYDPQGVHIPAFWAEEDEIFALADVLSELGVGTIQSGGGRDAELQNRLMFTSAHGMTALLDGIYLGLSQMKGAHNTKKALLIISDGGDNHSRYTETDVRRYVKEADVQIYAIGIFESQPCNMSPEECHGPALLSELTQMTGGRSFAVNQLGQLPDIASKISMELRNQYVLGYRPGNRAHDGKWRKIKVKLRPPKGLPPLAVNAKSGYYAPGH